MAVIDVTGVEAEAKAELQEEAAKAAKGRLKDHLRKLSQARAVVANLEREYEVLLKTIALDE